MVLSGSVYSQMRWCEEMLYFVKWFWGWEKVNKQLLINKHQLNIERACLSTEMSQGSKNLPNFPQKDLVSLRFVVYSFSASISFVSLQDNGHHQVESHIRNKLDSLLKESRIGDKEDTDSFSIRALLRATHQGLQKNLRQVRPPGGERGMILADSSGGETTAVW